MIVFIVVECLTISSDEETEPEQFVSSDNSDVSVSILNKEPPIEREDDASNRSSSESFYPCRYNTK